MLLIRRYAVEPQSLDLFPQEQASELIADAWV